MKRDITVAAEVRASRGKNEARRTRRAGQIPAVVYGAYQGRRQRIGQPARDPQDRPQRDRLQHHFQSGDRRAAKPRPVMVVDQQVDPVRRARCCTPI